MQKKKDTSAPTPPTPPSKKQLNNFKTLYQLTKQRRSQLNNNIANNTNNTINSTIPNLTKQTNHIKLQIKDNHKFQQIYEQANSYGKNKIIIKETEKDNYQKSQVQKDSLDDLCIENQEQKQIPIQVYQKLNKQGKTKQKSTQVNNLNKNNLSKKKSSHNRSNSCPFMNISHLQPKIQPKYQKFPPYFQKLIQQNQSKRTLKKTSTLHRKNKRIDHKYSISRCSQFSHQSNTVIVHSLPLQHLSSMLYESHYEKQHNFKKSGLTQVFPQHVFTIHNDIYFQTRLQQQIKMYDLSQQMKKLHKQTDNVKIKQVVLQKLANNFQSQDYQQHRQQDSLLIH